MSQAQRRITAKLFTFFFQGRHTCRCSAVLSTPVTLLSSFAALKLRNLASGPVTPWKIEMWLHSNRRTVWSLQSFPLSFKSWRNMIPSKDVQSERLRSGYGPENSTSISSSKAEVSCSGCQEMVHGVTKVLLRPNPGAEGINRQPGCLYWSCGKVRYSSSEPRCSHTNNNIVG